MEASLLKIFLPVINFHNHLITFYFIFINTSYILMLFVSYYAVKKYLRHIQSLELTNVIHSPFAKPISLLVPAYNEDKTIVESIRSILQLHYSAFEIILINDGSTDNTLEELKRAFQLQRTRNVFRKQLPCQNIRGIYESDLHPNLIVLDKDNGGKADSLNAGINASRYPLICSIDADSILEPDVLLKIVRPFIEDRTTVAAGGSVRIANGCQIKNGRVIEVGLPRNTLAKFQIMEYLRAFLAGRMAFSAFKSLIIISGAFGIFKKNTVIEVGGYRANSIGEDMELVVRMHQHLSEKKQPYNIVFIPDPVCWTQTPENLADLSKQRTRWQRGLLESLLSNKVMLFNPKYGAVGLLGFPFFLFVEGFGPFIEFTGFFIFLASLFFGLVDPPLALLFFLATIALNILLSTGAIIFEELTFRRYSGLLEIISLISLSLIEVFFYRPLTTWWRLVGIFQYASGKKGGWGRMDRKDFKGK